MSKRVKWSLVGVAVIAVGILGLNAFTSGEKAVEVRIEEVESRDLVESVTASGRISPQTKVDLSADITGRIVRLAVKEGDLVTRGQFLLQIDPQQYQAAVQRAEASLAQARAQEAQARANWLQAQRDYERMLEVQKANAQLISAEELDRLETSVEVQKALHDAARYTVEQNVAAMRDAEWALGRTTITAPMSGRVTRLNVEEGETAIMGTLNKDAATLLTIADMSVFETKVRVDETDVSRIKLGDSAVVQIDAFRDTTFTGRVTQISNSSVTTAAAQPGQETAIDYEVTIQLENPPADTRPDFSATAKVITAVRQNVLSVPIIALTVREEEGMQPEDSGAVPVTATRAATQVGRRDVEGVFLVGEDNRVIFRPVQVGIAGEKHFEVISGLQGGERIVGGTYQAIRGLTEGSLVREPAKQESPTQTKGVE